MQQNLGERKLRGPMRTLLFLALFLLIPAGVPAQSQNKELQANLDARVRQYSLSANGLVDALARTARDFQLPLGLEWVQNKETLRKLKRTWTGETPGEILRSIVKEYPGYTMRVEHGQIHVFRPDFVNDAHNFLNLKVPDYFEVRQDVGGVVNVRLQAVVQNIVSPRNLPPGAGEGGDYTIGNVPQKPFTLALRGLTAREALERLVEASEYKMWVVTFSDSRELTPTGFRRTQTLWHPSPFPDNQQPMWDLLAWEEYPPRPAVTSTPALR
jgi:hypothetical protein